MRLQGETRALSVVLTPEELEDRGADLAAAVRNADQEEQHLEGRKAAWREELKGLKEDLHTARSEASKLAEIVRTGREKRDVACNWLYALAAGYAFLVRDDTGERVASRRLKDEERQMEIGEAPFREPTPDQLEEWLKTLPVNEEEVLPEGHEATAADRAVDLIEDPRDWQDDDRPELTPEEQVAAYEEEVWNEDAEEVCGETFDHDIPPGTNVCRRCGAELLDDEGGEGAPVDLMPNSPVDPKGIEEDEQPSESEDDLAYNLDWAPPRGETFNPNPCIAELVEMPEPQVEELRRRGAKR